VVRASSKGQLTALDAQRIFLKCERIIKDCSEVNGDDNNEFEYNNTTKEELWTLLSYSLRKHVFICSLANTLLREFPLLFQMSTDSNPIDVSPDYFSVDHIRSRQSLVQLNVKPSHKNSSKLKLGSPYLGSMKHSKVQSEAIGDPNLSLKKDLNEAESKLIELNQKLNMTISQVSQMLPSVVGNGDEHSMARNITLKVGAQKLFTVISEMLKVNEIMVAPPPLLPTFSI
jgi:hypothetical protein